MILTRLGLAAILRDLAKPLGNVFDGTSDNSPQRVTPAGLKYTLTVSFLATPTTGPSPGATGPGGVPIVFGDVGCDQMTPTSGAIIIALAPDEVLVAGTGVTMTFDPSGPGDPIAGILSVHEGAYENGRWSPGLHLNGDQTHQGRHVRIGLGEFKLQRVKLYRHH